MILTKLLHRNAVSFEEALSRDKSNSRQGIQKHLILCFGKIPEWKDLDRAALNEFREYLLANLCQTTARVPASAKVVE